MNSKNKDRNWRAQEPGELHLLTHCSSHTCSTVTGRAYEPVNGMLSGIISVTLALRIAGNFTSFVETVTATILDSLRVEKRPPFGPSHPWSIRRDGLLALLLPPTSLRVASLRVLLTGDVCSDEIVWRCPGGASAEDRRIFARTLARELMPHKLEVFSRTRWLGSLSALAQGTTENTEHTNTHTHTHTYV